MTVGFVSRSGIIVFERREIRVPDGDNGCMDLTLISKRIEDLENSEPAEAPDLADELAEALARILDPDREASD